MDMMESMWHRRNPGKKHPLESGSKKVTPRPVSDEEKKSTDKSDRMYVAMRRVKDRQKAYSKAKSDAADRLHGEYTSRQSKIKKGASPSDLARLAALLPAKELPAGLCNDVAPLSGFGFLVSSPLS